GQCQFKKCYDKGVPQGIGKFGHVKKILKIFQSNPNLFTEKSPRRNKTLKSYNQPIEWKIGINE
ncbi:MAG: hypothetical protein LBB62_06090, partial [Proteiniphilum sp.]|nr:hypothetical protein [Proteiniphilum sp.]